MSNRLYFTATISMTECSYKVTFHLATASVRRANLSHRRSTVTVCESASHQRAACGALQQRIERGTWTDCGEMGASSESLRAQRGMMGGAHCYNCVIYNDLERVGFERVLLLQSHEEVLSSRWSYGEDDVWHIASCTSTIFSSSDVGSSTCRSTQH